MAPDRLVIYKDYFEKSFILLDGENIFATVNQSGGIWWVWYCPVKMLKTYSTLRESLVAIQEKYIQLKSEGFNK